MSATEEASATRPYRSTLRELQVAQTRTAVLLAADLLFSERGWEKTNMRDVARAAGVSVETLYARFGSKAQLLEVVLDVAVVGDDEPVALASRKDLRGLGDEADLVSRAAQAAKVAATINERVAPLRRALLQGAAVEPSLAERLEQTQANSRSNVADAARLVAGRRLSAVEVDELWTLTGADVYEQLCHWSAWSRPQYERWLTQRIVDVVNRDAGND